jgi:hypothetical protein
MIQKQSIKLTSEIDEVLEKTSSKIAEFRYNEQKLTTVVNQADGYVSDVKDLIQRRNTQEIIDKKDESVCELTRLTSKLSAHHHILNVLENLEGIRFKKMTEVST